MVRMKQEFTFCCVSGLPGSSAFDPDSAFEVLDSDFEVPSEIFIFCPKPFIRPEQKRVNFAFNVPVLCVAALLEATRL